jgi:hypothetical protein
MSGAIPLKVMVHESWDAVPLEVDPQISAAELKSLALAKACATLHSDHCEIKFRGALVRDESRSLAGLGVTAGAQLIVLPRRRLPVR